jgi:hypothetical protein
MIDREPPFVHFAPRMRLKISIPAICAVSLGVTTFANAQFKPAMIEGGPDAVMKLVNVQKLM